MLRKSYGPILARRIVRPAIVLFRFLGTDLNCGVVYGSLGDAVRRGLVSEDLVDRSLARLLRARFRLGMFDSPDLVPYAQIPYSVVDSDAHRALALEVAQQSLVLLKNQGDLLPLDKDTIDTGGCLALVLPMVRI